MSNIEISAEWPDMTEGQQARILEYGKACVMAGAQAGRSPLVAEIDRLSRELADAKSRAIDWTSHPETIEAKRQWDAVATALGADKDCPDSVLKAASARAGSATASLPDGWVAVPEIPTIEMLIASDGWREYDTPDSYPRGVEPIYGAYRAMLSARPEPPPNGLPSKESDHE